MSPQGTPQIVFPNSLSKRSAQSVEISHGISDFIVLHIYE